MPEFARSLKSVASHKWRPWDQHQDAHAFCNKGADLSSWNSIPSGWLWERLTAQIRPAIVSNMGAEHRFGGLAQLGERLNGIQEVRGSSPLSSIGLKHGHILFCRRRISRAT